MKKHRFKTWILLSVIVVLASLSVSCSQSRNHDATTEYRSFFLSAFRSMLYAC